MNPAARGKTNCTYRAIAILVACVFVTTRVASAQSTSDTAANDKAGAPYQLQLNLAVPETPAAKMLEVDGSSVLRPATLQQLVAGASDFSSSSGGLQFPKSYAVEVAPFFLSKGRYLSIREYQANPALYRFRVSAAANRGDGAQAPVRMALAVRFTLVDDADPRFDRRLTAAGDSLGVGVSRICARESDLSPPTGEPHVIASCADPRERQAEINKQLAAALVTDRNNVPRLRQDSAMFASHVKEVQKELDTLNKQYTDTIQKYTDIIKPDWADQNWNASGFDVALGTSARTKDSVGRDPKLSSVNAWAGYAIKLRQWGQFVTGLQLARSRDSVTNAMVGSGSFGAQLLVGGNKFKGYLQAEGTAQKGGVAIGARSVAGVELALISGVWANLAAGYERDARTGIGRAVTKFSFRTKFPQATPGAAAATTKQ